MLFQTITLGCKVNQYETQLIRETFLANGWREAADGQADLVVINTCSVTAESDAKGRKAASAAARANPRAKLAVIGCGAASDPEAMARLRQVAYVVPDKRKLPEFFKELGLRQLPEGVTSLGTRHRAYVKVQDGCRVGCAYCQVPLTRPYLQSRPADSVAREVRRLAEAGYREIVLTGIHLGHYGLDFDAIDFPASYALVTNLLVDYLASRDFLPPEKRHTLTKLLERLMEEDLPVRFRLGSLEAAETGDDLIDLVARSAGRVCPHFHLSMQSGSDAVLSRMRRRYRAEEFLDRCALIRQRIPNAALTTDVIVGFPGESDDDFAASCELVKKIGFAKTHIFRYSPRPKTLAADYPDQIPEPVKKQRAAELGKAADAARDAYAAGLIGKTVHVLIEQTRPGSGGALLAGTSEYYLEAAASADDFPLAGCGQILTAAVTSAGAGELRIGPVKGE